MAAVQPCLQYLPSPISQTKISPPKGRASPLLAARKNRTLLPLRSKGFGAESADLRKEAKEEDDEIPQVVFDRMVRRILAAVGLPMGGGLLVLILLGAVKERGLWDVPAWVPFGSTLLCFGTSALGIAYGTLSTSWDEERDGSLLGWEEATKNWPKLWEEEDREKRV